VLLGAPPPAQAFIDYYDTQPDRQRRADGAEPA